MASSAKRIVELEKSQLQKDKRKLHYAIWEKLSAGAVKSLDWNVPRLLGSTWEAFKYGVQHLLNLKQSIHHLEPLRGTCE